MGVAMFNQALSHKLQRNRTWEVTTVPVTVCDTDPCLTDDEAANMSWLRTTSGKKALKTVLDAAFSSRGWSVNDLDVKNHLFSFVAKPAHRKKRRKATIKPY